MSFEYFEHTLHLLLPTVRKLIDKPDLKEVQRWLNFTSVAITNLEDIVSSEKNLSHPQKQKSQTFMTHLIRIQNQLQEILTKTGGNLEEAAAREKICWNNVSSAFKKRICSGVITNLGHKEISTFIDDCENLFKNKIQTELKKLDSLKVNVELCSEYTIQKNDVEEIDIKYFNTENDSIFKSTDLDRWYNDNVKGPILYQIEEFQGTGSGWSLLRILSLNVNINQYSPIKGSSYIPLPNFIKKKKACVNVRNKDNQCFKWAVLSCIHAMKIHVDRVSLYKPFEKELNFKGIDFPVSLNQIKKFEKQNSISINVYMLKKYGSSFKVSPCHVTSHYHNKHINLLLIQDSYIDENEEQTEDDSTTQSIKFHYVWIKNLSRLARSQNTKHKSKFYICDRCLHYFTKKEQLEQHKIDCMELNKCKVKLPNKKDNILQFKNFKNKEKVPYVIYADFECLLRSVDGDRAFQRHEAYSIGFYVKCSYDDSKSSYNSYRQEVENEETPAQWFIKRLQEITTELDEKYKNPVPMDLTDEEEHYFQKSTICHICRKSFKDGENKVRDHDHLTGE